MPRHYKAVTDHRPIDYQKDLDAISRYSRGRGDDLRAIFLRWKLRPLEEDEIGALISRVTRRLVDFALVCDAVPMRTPQKLMATVSRIAKRPDAFLASSHTYDPEAVALLYDAFARGSPDNRLLLSLFEVGEGPPPSAKAIALAASQVQVELQTQSDNTPHVGGQTLVLQRELIQDLAVIFLKFGGSLKPSTRFNIKLPASYSYHGPLHDFLTLVLPPVRKFASRAGFKMESIRSLAKIPDVANRSESKGPISLLGKCNDTEPDRIPARVGNFFKLHGHRLKNRKAP